MAACMRQSIAKGVTCLLNAARFAPSSLVIPVRTKKRLRLPPRSYDSMEEQQKQLKAAGIAMSEEKMAQYITITCTRGIFDPYIPPEGDARMSMLSKEGLLQRTEKLRQTAKSYTAIRKIRESDRDFRIKTFAEKAQEIFIEAHNNLANLNEEKLHSLVTEHCYPEMVQGNECKTIRWSFLESLEPPRVVHVRCPTMLNEDLLYGQVTVRIHIRQILAIYDQFGRLMYGSEQIPKDVLEYVVFERHLLHKTGHWRLHDKIVPSWAPPKDPLTKTVMIPGLIPTPSEA
ncbi:39S ribosomal protein L45, mitochondrial [Protobothrops mucrosquamatus]|uniref:39S ribosomal protein L45, mitochondrial n=1 Tax=Protobothrops mucrosquamatus TaxID=103944 RepID=UPI000775C472|nr:39S ribosomal protein L45, mitochondrial [Protobothrops mucrosquamatus]